MIGAIIARKKIAHVFNALNRHDLPTFMSDWRDDGVYVYPGEITESGTFQGKSVVEGWFRHFLEQFPSIQFDVKDICVKNIFDLTGTNVVAVHWDVRLTNKDGYVGENTGVTVISIESGKVFLAKNYVFELGSNFKRYWSAV